MSSFGKTYQGQVPLNMDNRQLGFYQSILHSFFLLLISPVWQLLCHFRFSAHNTIFVHFLQILCMSWLCLLQFYVHSTHIQNTFQSVILQALFSHVVFILLSFNFDIVSIITQIFSGICLFFIEVIFCWCCDRMQLLLQENHPLPI